MCSSRSGCSPGGSPGREDGLHPRAHCPTRRRYCAASAGGQCDESPTLRSPSETTLRSGEQLHQRRGMQRFAWAEILFIGELRNGSTGRSADNHHNRKYGCRLVDGTPRDCTFQFNGEIGDAAPGVDGIGLNDGPVGQMVMQATQRHTPPQPGCRPAGADQSAVRRRKERSGVAA